MDKAALCRAISEKLEPKPKFTMGYTNSHCGFWRRIATARGAAAWHPGELPVDFFNDECASARLLDAVPFVLTGGDKDEDVICNMIPEGSGPGFTGKHKDRKTAVVLATKARLRIEGEL